MRNNEKKLQEAYRKGYKAGHMKGTYAQSKRMNRAVTRNFCPSCKEMSVTVSNIIVDTTVQQA